MVTQEQAGNLSFKYMQLYVNECECRDHQDVANVLMKLASSCGIAMIAVVGKEEAVDRMQETTDFVASSDIKFKAERAN